eukprot:5052650-Alexandrium_andersonii.AAC.1
MSVAQLLGTEGVVGLDRLDPEVSEGGAVKSDRGDTQRPSDAEAGAVSVTLKLKLSSGTDERLEVSGSGGGGGGVLL